MKKTDSFPKTRIQTLGVDPISLSRELLFQVTIRKPKHRRNFFYGWHRIFWRNSSTTRPHTCHHHAEITQQRPLASGCSWQTAHCHVTTALRSRLRFTFEPQEGLPAVSDLRQCFLPLKIVQPRV